MGLVSMLARERFCDRPYTACPVIGAFLRPYNELAGNRARQDLLGCAASVVGTRRPEVEAARVQRCVDTAVDCYHALSRWRRVLYGEHRLMMVRTLANRPPERSEIDRLRHHVAQLVPGAPDRRAR